jgi:hypothetical protein
MQFLRLFSCAAVASALVATTASCSSGPGSTFNNGTFTAPSQVTVGQAFTASYVANTPSVYPNVQVLPVSTAYIQSVAGAPTSFKAQAVPGQAWLYAVSGGELLDYRMITIVGASQ